MIIELPRRTEHFGSVRFHEVQRVYELDSGLLKFDKKAREAVATISSEDIGKINQKMAIVIPIKDEKLRLLEGVLSGIPHDCYVIVVSNSRRSPVDRYTLEVEMLRRFNHFVGDEISLIHQQDPRLSEAFKSVGFNSILGEDGSVRSGKAEAMFIGILLAKMIGKEYVGFVDADNYVPGAVHEYVDTYAAGFFMAESPFSMVRVSWVYKPKIMEDKLFFAQKGRVTSISNSCLNHLLAYHTGFGTEIIKTANSGEHAMSMPLADVLCYASGFAVEPYEIINMLERFGGIYPAASQILSSGVDFFQIESRNPHLHEDKGSEHLKRMLLSSISCMYHSQLCPRSVRQKLFSSCADHGYKISEDELSPPAIIRPPAELNMERFTEALKGSQAIVELKL